MSRLPQHTLTCDGGARCTGAAGAAGAGVNVKFPPLFPPPAAGALPAASFGLEIWLTAFFTRLRSSFSSSGLAKLTACRRCSPEKTRKSPAAYKASKTIQKIAR